MRKPLAAVILFAMLVRGGALLLAPGALAGDPDGYLRLAENLVEHGVFGDGETPTAYRPPLYPLMLTGCAAAGDGCRACIGMLHVLLGAAAVGLVFVLGTWWGLGRRGATLAAVLVACDPILLYQSTQIMSETAAALLAVLGLVALTWTSRRSSSADAPSAARENSPLPLGEGSGVRAIMPATLAGGVLALGALCRPTLLSWLAACCVTLILLQHKNSNSRRLTASGTIAGTILRSLRPPAAFALGAAVVLAPWTIRNWVQFGRPLVATTHGGYTLLLANNTEFHEWLRSGEWGSVWAADDFNSRWKRRRPDDEVAADRLAYAEAWRTIRRRPGTFAHACLVRLGRFWSPLAHRLSADESPARRLARWAAAGWYVLEYMFAAYGAWLIFNRRRAPGTNAGAKYVWGLLLVGSLTAVHAVFWTDMRMRAAAMPVVALLAAAGAYRSFNGRRHGDPDSPPTPAWRDRDQSS